MVVIVVGIAHTNIAPKLKHSFSHNKLGEKTTGQEKIDDEGREKAERKK